MPFDFGTVEVHEALSSLGPTSLKLADKLRVEDVDGEMLMAIDQCPFEPRVPRLIKTFSR